VVVEVGQVVPVVLWQDLVIPEGVQREV
jgi:hypothetical protein